jgi:hypothetical protein
MVWQDGIGNADNAYDWILRFLADDDGELLELELDVDGQHFFDNMELLLAEPSSPQPNDLHSSPLQLTPFILSMISDLQDPSPQDEAEEAAPAPSVSFCALLEEAQSAAESRAQTSHHAATTPRRRRSRELPTAATPRTAVPTKSLPKRATRSSSRKKLKRRLFY